MITVEVLTWAAWGFIGMCLGVGISLHLRGFFGDDSSHGKDEDR